MTVKEYREKHPDCKYCNHTIHFKGLRCPATRRLKTKLTAKKCPCYMPADCITDVALMMKKVNL